MTHLIKKIVRGGFNAIGFDIINKQRSPNTYFYKPKEVSFHPCLQSVRRTIYNECPSEEYRESYHIHQIGAWGPLPAVIDLLAKTKSNMNLASLDIGCAFGTMAAFCHCLGFRASAVDFTPLDKHLGEETRARYDIDYHQVALEMEPLPFQERKFDIVTMTEVLEHFRYQPVDALRKIRGVLKDDGVFLLTTPALGPHWTAEYHAGPFETIPPYRGENEPSVDKHWKIYDAEELGRLLRTAGFDAAVTLYLNINTGNEGLYAFATKVAMTPPHSTRIP